MLVEGNNANLIAATEAPIETALLPPGLHRGFDGF